MAARHQQAGRVGPQGGAGQHRCGTAQVHHKARIQLALLHALGHGVVVQQAEPHLGRLDLGPQGGLHLLELLHHRRGMALQAHAPVGEAELVVGAEEERPAQFGLEGRDALTQSLSG